MAVENLSPGSSIVTPEDTSRKKAENPSGIDHLAKAMGANFLDFPTSGLRERSRLFVNGGPDHMLTARWRKGVMGEEIHVFAAGDKGPTVLALANYIGPGGEREAIVNEVMVKGQRGGSELVDDAIDHLAEIFPDYSLVAEVTVDGKGNKMETHTSLVDEPNPMFVGQDAVLSQ